MKRSFNEWIVRARSEPRFFLTVAIATVLICFVDFATRIFVPRDDDLRKFVSPAVEKLPTSVEVVKIQGRLSVALPEPRRVEEQPKPRELALQGIFISRSIKTAALVLLPQGDKPLERRNVPEGAEIDGWVVESIAGSRVTLRKGSESRELVMFRGRTDR